MQGAAAWRKLEKTCICVKRSLTEVPASLIFPAPKRSEAGDEVNEMVSATTHTKTRRAIRQRRAGRSAKRARLLAGTPKFAVHPEGYDAKAADAKPSQGKSH